MNDNPSARATHEKGMKHQENLSRSVFLANKTSWVVIPDTCTSLERMPLQEPLNDPPLLRHTGPKCRAAISFECNAYISHCEYWMPSACRATRHAAQSRQCKAGRSCSYSWHVSIGCKGPGTIQERHGRKGTREASAYWSLGGLSCHITHL